MKFLYAHREDCPDVDKHTAAPSDYLAWQEWAEQKSTTHKVKRCPTCRYWAIWVPKKAQPEDAES